MTAPRWGPVALLCPTFTPLRFLQGIVADFGLDITAFCLLRKFESSCRLLTALLNWWWRM